MYIYCYGEVPRNLSRNETIRILKEHGVTPTENERYTIDGVLHTVPNSSFDDKYKVREMYSTKLVFDYLEY